MNRLNKIPFLSRMRRYQKSGARLIDRMGGRCILADPMGVGKTWQALAYLAMYPELRPAVIVMPGSIKLKWADEIANLLPGETMQVVHGKKPFVLTGSILLINYDILHYSVMLPNPKYDPNKPGSKKKVKKFFAREELINNAFLAIVGDEIHKISNNKTGRAIAFLRLCKGVKTVLVLSGTPIEDKPISFYPILKLIDPITFGNWLYYITRYCDAKRNWFGWDTSGSSNVPELHEKVSKIMIRREKRTLLPELPPKIKSIIPLEIDNRRVYDRAKNEYIRWVEANGGNVEKVLKAEAMTQVGVLRRLAVQGILKQAIKWVGDYLESGNKLVVGCEHREINNTIFAQFKKQAVQFMGGMDVNEKYAANKAFQENPKIRLAVCNIKTAAEGLDLYAAPATCTIEFLWNPYTHEQFEARVDRIGQTSDTIMAYYLVGVDTVMLDMAKILDKKRKTGDGVVDGKKVDSAELFTKLINQGVKNVTTL